MSMRQIFETNFEETIEGDTLRLRLFSRRVLGTMPDGATLLHAELPACARAWSAAIEIAWTDGDGQAHRVPATLGQPIAVPPGCRFELRLLPEGGSPGLNGKHIKHRPRAFLKRLASEARDRLFF
jgi:hypothetical protein